MSTLDDLLAPVNTVVFTLGSHAVTWAELLGFLTGAAGVWLTVRAHIANFAVGLANNVFFFLLFADARLFADATLQVLFFVLGGGGWWAWLRAGPRRTALVVATTSRAHLLAVAAAVVVATAVLTPVLRSVDDSAPFLDALITAGSLGAQWLLNLKRVESWWLWVAVDCVSVPLYLSRDLLLTAAVYALFLVMCLLGLRQWRAAVAVPAGELAVAA